MPVVDCYLLWCNLVTVGAVLENSCVPIVAQVTMIHQQIFVCISDIETVIRHKIIILQASLYFTDVCLGTFKGLVSALKLALKLNLKK